MPADERELLPLGTGFDVVRRGYDRGQVEEHLDRVEADLRILTADRDAAVGQASELARALDQTRSHVEELRAQIDRLAAPPDTMEGLSERLQRMLRLAQDEAREMRRQADAGARQVREDADQYARRTTGEADERARARLAEIDQQSSGTIGEAQEQARRTTTGADEYARATTAEADQRARGTIDAAEAQAAQILEQARQQARELGDQAEAHAAEARTRYDGGLADNDRRRAEMEDEHRGVLHTAHGEADRLRTDAESERTRLDQESDERRRQVEEDFEIAMAGRRQESMRQLSETENQARERADKLVREATDEARRRVQEADAEVAGLRRLRNRVGKQLSTLQTALGALPSVDAFPDEDGGSDGHPVLPDPTGSAALEHDDEHRAPTPTVHTAPPR